MRCHSMLKSLLSLQHKTVHGRCLRQGHAASRNCSRMAVCCSGRSGSKLLQLLESEPDLEMKIVRYLAEVDHELYCKDAELAQAKLKVEELQTQLVTAELLFFRGLLHPRGIIEYAEEKLYRSDRTGIDLTRAQKWEKILASKPGLLKCTKCACRGNVTNIKIAYKIANVYESLSSHIHQFTVSRTRVDIFEGPLNKEQMRLVECIAKEIKVECRMVYMKSVATSSGDENDSGASDIDSS